MTIAELIELLKRFDQDLPVFIWDTGYVSAEEFELYHNETLSRLEIS